MIIAHGAIIIQILQFTSIIIIINIFRIHSCTCTHYCLSVEYSDSVVLISKGVSLVHVFLAFYAYIIIIVSRNHTLTLAREGEDGCGYARL